MAERIEQELIPDLSLGQMRETAEGLIPAIETTKGRRRSSHPFDKHAFNRMKSMGPYVSCGDNTSFISSKVDVRLGLPSFAYVAMRHDSKEHNSHHWTLMQIERLTKLPMKVFPTGDGIPLQVSETVKFDGDKYWQTLQYFVTMDKDGYVYPCTYSDTKPHSFRTRAGWITARTNRVRNYDESFTSIRNTYELDGGDDGMSLSDMVCWCMNVWLSRQNCWNARFQSDKARVTFGFDLWEAKKVFAKRQAYLTGSGRRQPIIHFVASHYRKKNLARMVRKYVRSFPSWFEGVWRLFNWRTIREFWREYNTPSTVKTHLRGASSFLVGDYEVDILQDKNNSLAKTNMIIGLDDEVATGSSGDVQPLSRKSFKRVLDKSMYYTVGRKRRVAS